MAGVSRLLLIRHGQASFGAAEYDNLSELGRRQGLALGRHWAATRLSLDAIYCGPRRRHKDTLDAALLAAREAGHDLPEPIAHEGLDEYPAIELFKQHVGEFSTVRSIKTITEKIEAISRKWIDGTLELGGLESYADFHARSDATFEQIRRDQGRGRTVAVMTSGGPISIALKSALSLTPHNAGKLAWVIVNASISEFRYRDDDVSLFSFNSTPHLDDHSLVTYR
jgi:broad specificity phosphatase PhoE